MFDVAGVRLGVTANCDEDVGATELPIWVRLADDEAIPALGAVEL